MIKKVIMNLEVKIETDNLLLLPISLEYKEDIFKEFSPEITVFMFPKPAEKIEETEEFINESVKQKLAGTDLVVVVLDKNTKAYLGNAGLHNINTRTPEFGIWIKKSAHGNGFGKESIFALKKWADKNLKYEYILYPVDKENIASRRIPETLGGKVFREYEEKNLSGNNLQLLEYRIYP